MNNPLKATFGYKLIKVIYDEFGIGMILWFISALCQEIKNVETTDNYDYNELAIAIEKLIRK